MDLGFATYGKNHCHGIASAASDDRVAVIHQAMKAPGGEW